MAKNINMRLKAVKKVEKGLEVKGQSSSQKINLTALKKLVIFFANHALRSWMLLSLTLVIVVTFIITNALLVNGQNYLNRSLLLIAPYFFEGIGITFFLAWRLFAASKRDGTSQLVLSKKYSRANVFLAKNLVIFMTFVAVLLVQTLISLIFNFAIGMGVTNAFIFSLLMFAAALAIAFTMGALAQLIAVAFNEIIAIITLVIVGVVMVGAPFVTREAVTSKPNSLSWDLTQNSQNYAKLIKTSPKGEILSEQVVVYDNGAKPNNQLNQNANNISSNNGYGLFINKLTTTPFESYASSALRLPVNQIVALSQSTNLSILNLTDESTKRISDLNTGGNYFSYGIDDFNPLETSYDDLLAYWKSTLSSWDNAQLINIFDETTAQQLLQRFTDDPKWLNINLTAAEKTLIRKLIGLNKADALLFYLFRDYPLLSGKYQKVFENLKTYNLLPSAIDLIQLLYTNDEARNNILQKFLIAPQSEMEALFPLSLGFDTSLAALPADIRQVQQLISNVSVDSTNDANSTVSILSDDSAKGYVTINYQFDQALNITSKAAWDNYVAKSPELKNLNNIYTGLQQASKTKQVTLKTVNFSKNTTDLYQYSKVIDVKVQADETPMIVTWTVLIAIGVLAMLGAFFIDRFKDIK